MNEPTRKIGSTKTTIVNVADNECDVFIGRPSRLCNPFKIGRDGDRAQVIRKFETWARLLIKDDADFAARVKALHGKVLGCYRAGLHNVGKRRSKASRSPRGAAAVLCALCELCVRRGRAKIHFKYFGIRASALRPASPWICR
jgi:hypothetical protein